ncbi:hypothetical protein AAULR_23751, partial [Lacticaseibacillus rhamnosus MTCC 5462]
KASEAAGIQARLNWVSLDKLLLSHRLILLL